MAGDPNRRIDHFFHVYWIRFGFDGGRGMQESKTRRADRDYRDAGGLHDPLHSCRGGAHRASSMAVADGRRRSGREYAEAAAYGEYSTYRADRRAAGDDFF